MTLSSEQSPSASAIETIMVEIGGIAVRRDSGILVSYALGSCIGIAMYDPVARLGGMLHVQLPSSKIAISPTVAANDPGRYVDTGMPKLLELMTAQGAVATRLRTVIAGAATMPTSTDFFAIASRNLTALRKWLWTAKILVAAEDLGGTLARNMRLDVATGEVEISLGGSSRILYPGLTP